jgi:hypothetical protein
MYTYIYIYIYIYIAPPPPPAKEGGGGVFAAAAAAAAAGLENECPEYKKPSPRDANVGGGAPKTGFGFKTQGKVAPNEKRCVPNLLLDSA